MKSSVLIFASKPPIKIPKFDCLEVFSSNGSAELAKVYINKFKSVQHTCVIGARSFTKLDHIKLRVINSEPNKIVIRDFDKVYEDISKLFKNYVEISMFTKTQQIYFQRKFFKHGIISLLLAETNYEKKIINKIKHLISGFLFNGFMGVSTGFFAMLYAAHKYPNSNLILSGLSFEGGEHFYNDGKMTENRGYVDNYLFQLLSNRVKDRIYTCDKEISKKLNIKNLNVDEILLK